MSKIPRSFVDSSCVFRRYHPQTLCQGSGIDPAGEIPFPDSLYAVLSAGPLPHPGYATGVHIGSGTVHRHQTDSRHLFPLSLNDHKRT